MLGWVKDKIGRKQSPLEALVAGAFKDEAEKQALLEALATTDALKAEELVPLLVRPDASIQQRASVLFLTRATQSAALALIDAVLTADAAARPILMKTALRVKAEYLKHGVDIELRDAKQDRLRAAWELALDLPPELSEAYVEKAFKDGPPKTRADALRRMMAKRSAEELRPTLIAAMEDREARVRKIAIDAIISLTGNDVFDAMLDRVANEDTPEIRQIAGGYLQKFIASAPPEMRPAILGRLLLSGDADLRAQLIRAIFATGSHYETLLEILTFAKTVLGVQHAAVLDSLTPLGDGLVDHALRVLQHQDPDIRIQAILLLERFTSPKTTRAVLRLLEDADWWVRIMACDTLGRIKDARTLPYLGKLLGDAECKWAAIDAIGAIGGEGAFAALLGLLKDKQNEVRLAAVKALGKLDDKRVDSYIEDIAKSDPSLDIKVRAVELLRHRRGGKGNVEAAVSSAHLTRPMEKLLAYAREANASDLHLTPDEPPFLRVNGIIERLKMRTLSRAHVDAMIDDILDPVRRPILAQNGSVDFCYSIPGVGRYRVNCFRQLRGTSAVVRVIPNVTPTLSGLGLPKHLDEIGMYHQGIILLTGPAGSGKSTSLTALVNLLNETRSTHILTLEDPIEFLHTPKKALINQREIGRDSKSFAAAMRGALREDPDIIVVGELRDKETIRLAMIAAETGHLVIATMQTTGATATVDKIVESFPADEQAQIRMQLAGSLKHIISQLLVPRIDGQGRAAVFEILKATSSVCAIIRDGKTFQLGSAMQIGRTQGMLTIDASLEALLSQGVIALETAFTYAQKKETFAKAARGIQAKDGSVTEGAEAAAPPAIDPPSVPPPSSRPQMEPPPSQVTVSRAPPTAAPPAATATPRTAAPAAHPRSATVAPPPQARPATAAPPPATMAPPPQPRATTAPAATSRAASTPSGRPAPTRSHTPTRRQSRAKLGAVGSTKSAPAPAQAAPEVRKRSIIPRGDE